MVLESAQLLSTAMSSLGLESPYRSTHVNHPCSKWTRASKANYQWLLRHFVALCGEYTARYEKTHKCESFLRLFEEAASAFPEQKQTPFANCTTYKDEPDTCKAYRQYLADKWAKDKRRPTWGRKLLTPPYLLKRTGG